MMSTHGSVIWQALIDDYTLKGRKRIEGEAHDMTVKKTQYELELKMIDEA